MNTQATQSPSFSQNLHNGRLWTSQGRHPVAFAVVRLVVAAWLVALGSVLCSYGYWGGAFIYLAAVAHLVLAYRLLKTSRAA
jgi:hypothetical protein